MVAYRKNRYLGGGGGGFAKDVFAHDTNTGGDGNDDKDEERGHEITRDLFHG